MLLNIGECENKTNLEVDKQKIARDTASETKKPKYELSVDTLQNEQFFYGYEEDTLFKVVSQQREIEDMVYSKLLIAQLLELFWTEQNKIK